MEFVMDINFLIVGLFFTSAPSRPSVFHPPLPTPASSLTHTRCFVLMFADGKTLIFNPVNPDPVWIRADPDFSSLYFTVPDTVRM